VGARRLRQVRVELSGDGPLIGCVGLELRPGSTRSKVRSRSVGVSTPGTGAMVTPPKAALASLKVGFDRLGLDRIVRGREPATWRRCGSRRRSGYAWFARHWNRSSEDCSRSFVVEARSSKKRRLADRCRGRPALREGLGHHDPGPLVTPCPLRRDVTCDQYLGSKRRLVQTISALASGCGASTAADLFTARRVWPRS